MTSIIPVLYGARDKTSRDLLGVLDGLYIEAAASAARTDETANAIINTFDLGTYGFKRLAAVLDVTAAATETADKLDVMIDVSMDGSTWVNVIHFTQHAGDGGAAKYFAATPDVGSGVEEAVTSDVAAGGTPRVFFGRYVRVRQTITEASTDNASFTYSVDIALS